MNERTFALARSFKLATMFVMHAPVEDNACWVAARDAAELTGLVRKIARYNVLKCNQPTTKRQDTVARKALAWATEIADKYGAKLHIGDPRGPVRIYWADELPKGDPDTYTNCMHDIQL